MNQPANIASVRENYEASHTLKNINSSHSVKILRLESLGSQDSSLRRQEVISHGAVDRLNDRF